jgi:ceramide glucosyltransferase
MTIFHDGLEAIAVAIAYSSIAYVALTLWRVLDLYGRQQVRCQNRPPITILKPVCSRERSLYQNLRSFCEQDYPAYQVIFGVRDPGDPAIAVIEQLIRDLPHRDLRLVVDARIVGANYKMSNLANMLATADHDILVVADSDVRVGGDYLTAIAAPFEDPSVGAVTCLYAGVPVENSSSILASMFINEWFFPTVHVGLLFEKLRFCFGATMAIRRKALEAIGGFEALASYLADDYMLGKLTSDHGYKIKLSPYIVDIVVDELTFKTMFLHELRWARTMRAVRPASFACTFLTDAVPVSIIVAMAFDLDAGGVLLIGLALALRIGLHYAVRAPLHVAAPARPWLVPVRDLLSFAVRIASFLGRSVSWRGQKFRVRSDGQMLVAK